MDLRAKYRSSGFRKRTWEEGQIANNITPDELKMSEMQHFEVIDGCSQVQEPKDEKVRLDNYDENSKDNGVNSSDIDEVMTLSLKTFRDEYVKKFKKEVPNRYKNDLDWLQKMTQSNS